MRRRAIIFASGFGVLLLTAPHIPCSAAKYVQVAFQVPGREHPLSSYEAICKEQVIPEFIAEMKKQNPSIDEKRLAEEITVMAGEQRGQETMTIYIEADREQIAAAYAVTLAEMALRKFLIMDEAERVESLQRIVKEQEGLQAAREALTEQLQQRGKDPRLDERMKAMDSLVERLNSYKQEVVQAELRNAELEAKLNLLSKKAEQAKQAVSSEEVAFLRKMATELAMKTDEASSLRQQIEIRRHEIILRQKAGELKRTGDLRKQNMASEKELKDAEAAYELAKNECELARAEIGELKQRLEKVHHELMVAQKKFAETGGLSLAAIVAEKTLECETEMAAVRQRGADLRRKIEETQKEIDDIRALSAESEKRMSEFKELGTRLTDLGREERKLEMSMRNAREARDKLDREARSGYFRTNFVDQLGPERSGTYYVIGEVANPGSKSLLGKTAVLKAITAAGGFTENADPEKVLLILAAGPSRQVVDCKAILKGGKPDDLEVRAGSMILVPRMNLPE